MFQTEVISAEDHEFIKFVAKYGRSYATRAEFDFRNVQFKQSLAKIAEHNSQEGQTSTVGINQFADMTKEEIKRMNGYKSSFGNQCFEDALHLNVSDLPDEVNWDLTGAVGPVKNQGQCGSCWAFSATGAIEASNFLNTGTFTPFSEQ